MKNSGVRKLIADLELGYALGNAVERLCEDDILEHKIVNLEEAKSFIDIQLAYLRKEVRRLKDAK